VEVAMIVCTLRWTEPEDGTHTMLFPNNEDLTDLMEVAAFCKKSFGNEVGHTIASMKLEQKGQSGAEDPLGNLPWNDLALNVRYSSGEDLYEKDCPEFKKRGIERC
jgi:hypothetical protein